MMAMGFLDEFDMDYEQADVPYLSTRNTGARGANTSAGDPPQAPGVGIAKGSPVASSSAGARPPEGQVGARATAGLSALDAGLLATAIAFSALLAYLCIARALAR